MYDAALRDFPLAANGDLQRVHWVDQKVALKLAIAEGDVAGTPTLGSRLRELKRGAPAQLQRRAEDAVSLALQQMVTAREIQVVSVVATSPSRGKLLVVVTYRNLLLPNEKQRTMRIAA
jgi:phage gp46-like protein